jgi:hypothetical protein
MKRIKIPEAFFIHRNPPVDVPMDPTCPPAHVAQLALMRLNSRPNLGRGQRDNTRSRGSASRISLAYGNSRRICQAPMLSPRMHCKHARPPTSMRSQSSFNLHFSGVPLAMANQECQHGGASEVGLVSCRTSACMMVHASRAPSG